MAGFADTLAATTQLRCAAATVVACLVGSTHRTGALAFAHPLLSCRINLGLLHMLEVRPHSTTLYHNGIVHTQDATHHRAEALVIKGNRIQFVGSNAEARALAGQGARLVDLGGRLMLPGFIDGHVHFVWGGRHLLGIDLRACSTPKEFRNKVESYAAIHRGRWVIGGTWDHEVWPTKQLPTRQLIDDVTVGTPVFVQRLDSHMGLANSLALQLAGITAATPDPPGGMIERNPDSGEPTGILKDLAMNLMQAVIPKPSPMELEQAVLEAQQEARRNGITSVHDITMPEDYAAFQTLEQNRKLTVRIYTRLPIAGYRELAREGIQAGHGSPFLKVGSLKAFSDGSLGASTAWFFGPYLNDSTTAGLPMDIVTNGQLLSWALEADRDRLQLSIHAIGDRANRYVLDIADRISSNNASWDRRFRVEHAQHVRPEDIPLFRKFNVIVSAQPYHVIEDGAWAESRIGRERVSSSFTFRSFIDAGVTLCFGSDWTVAPLDAIAGIYAAVTRRTLDGKNPDGWIPAQKLTVDEAVRCYTINNAYAAFEEHEKGTLEPGKLADLVVVSRDLYSLDPSELRDAVVDMTIVDGNVVYER